MYRRTTIVATVATLLAGPVQAAVDPDDGSRQRATVDVLERPAAKSDIAAHRLLLSVARIGDRLVAVGPRGHIVVSTDAGVNWRQASVPVSSDLTAVWFASAQRGWAVGHDGVVLATVDGGMTWRKQIDGRGVNDLVLEDAMSELARHPDSAEAQALLAEAQRYQEQGPDKPFLDVWFENETTGFVVGAYNLLLKTTDGGNTWQSWFTRAENPRFMNLYSIRPAAGAVFVAGEAGTVLKLDPVAKRFVAVPVDYAGSLFGVTDAGDAVLVHGLRGNAFRSTDGGASWQQVASQLPATIVGGTRLDSGLVLLADQGGRIALSNDAGATFSLIPLQRSVPLTSIVDAGAGRLAVTGPFGVMLVAPDAAR